MYDRKTMDKEKIVKIVADNYRICSASKKDSTAIMCSVILWELMGLRICKSCGGSEVEVYNPKTYTTEYRFDSSSGKEII